MMMMMVIRMMMSIFVWYGFWPAPEGNPGYEARRIASTGQNRHHHWHCHHHHCHHHHCHDDNVIIVIVINITVIRKKENPLPDKNKQIVIIIAMFREKSKTCKTTLTSQLSPLILVNNAIALFSGRQTSLKSEPVENWNNWLEIGEQQQ